VPCRLEAAARPIRELLARGGDHLDWAAIGAWSLEAGEAGRRLAVSTLLALTCCRRRRRPTMAVKRAGPQSDLPPSATT